MKELIGLNYVDINNKVKWNMPSVFVKLQVMEVALTLSIKYK